MLKQRFQQHREKTRLGDMLVKRGLITQAQLNEALAYAKPRNVKIGDALTQLGFISSFRIWLHLRHQFLLRFVFAISATLGSLFIPFAATTAAANPSNVATQSVKVTLRIPPRVAVNTAAAQALTVTNNQASSNVCMVTTEAGSYSIRVSEENLLLTNQNGDQLPLDITMPNGQTFQTAASNAECNPDLGRVDMRIADIDTSSLPKGTYTGQFTYTVSVD